MVMSYPWMAGCTLCLSSGGIPCLKHRRKPLPHDPPLSVCSDLPDGVKDNNRLRKSLNYLDFSRLDGLFSHAPDNKQRAFQRPILDIHWRFW
jgi:hypothetical protein